MGEFCYGNKVLIGLSDEAGGTTPAPLLEIGAVVHHRLYKYRGVVISIDNCCMAGDAWYYANKTQPDKAQPWYHVLVHDSGGLSTYVAQSNLELDPSKTPIEHPRIGSYFSEFVDGRYLPLPGTSGSCSI